MPKKFQDFLPENDYAGRLALGLVLLLASQLVKNYPGSFFIVLRWALFAAALINYAVVLYLYQQQKQEKIAARTAEESQKTDQQ